MQILSVWCGLDIAIPSSNDRTSMHTNKSSEYAEPDLKTASEALRKSDYEIIRWCIQFWCSIESANPVCIYYLFISVSPEDPDPTAWYRQLRSAAGTSIHRRKPTHTTFTEFQLISSSATTRNQAIEAAPRLMDAVAKTPALKTKSQRRKSGAN
jgi:hypothetical protein